MIKAHDVLRQDKISKKDMRLRSELLLIIFEELDQYCHIDNLDGIKKDLVNFKNSLSTRRNFEFQKFTLESTVQIPDSKVEEIIELIFLKTPAYTHALVRELFSTTTNFQKSYKEKARALGVNSGNSSTMRITEQQNDAARDTYVPPSRVGKKQLTGYFDAAMVKSMRALALAQDTTVQALMEEALQDLFSKHQNELARLAPLVTRTPD